MVIQSVIPRYFDVRVSKSPSVSLPFFIPSKLSSLRITASTDNVRRDLVVFNLHSPYGRCQGVLFFQVRSRHISSLLLHTALFVLCNRHFAPSCVPMGEAARSNNIPARARLRSLGAILQVTFGTANGIAFREDRKIEVGSGRTGGPLGRKAKRLLRKQARKEEMRLLKTGSGIKAPTDRGRDSSGEAAHGPKGTQRGTSPSFVGSGLAFFPS